MAEYEALYEEFTKRNVLLITASVDSVEDARTLRDKLNLSFPVGYGLDGKQVAELLGGFYDDNKGFLNPTAQASDTGSTAIFSRGLALAAA